MRLKYLLSLVLITVLLGFSQELLLNGNFEQELSIGWTQTDSGSGTHQVQRGTEYQPDPDFEAWVYQYDNPGWTRLSQLVPVPGVALQLSFWAKLIGYGGTTTCWPAACVQVCYYDRDTNLLGETRYYHTTYADWQPSPTLSLYRVNDTTWLYHQLDIAAELTQNLPGVNPSEIAFIEVALWSYTYSG
uniref:DNRLRE domain-containing protein n=1 Tax=candidate division WOR-3 bacterium TaxID=2052148 RepID=A0A7V3PT94_UNCW3